MRNICIIKTSSGRIDVRNGSLTGNLLFSIPSSSDIHSIGNGLIQFNQVNFMSDYTINHKNVYSTIVNNVETLFNGDAFELMDILNNNFLTNN